jgi:4-methyl-5(b-hydroxyethyl)-thiazole monophosphate biosynthesis
MIHRIVSNIKEENDMGKKMAVLLAEGFEEGEAIVPADIAIRVGIEVTKVSVSGEEYVKGAHGISVGTDVKLSDFDPTGYDLLMLPGGMPGTTNLEKSAETAALIRRMDEAGAYIAAICAAPRILGDMGLLEGVRATVYPGNEARLKGARVDMEAKAVTDGRYITGRGMGCAVEFGGEITAALADAETAGKVLASIQY